MTKEELRHRNAALFTAYNAAARMGTIDTGRLNRGLGIAQRHDSESHIDRYQTTLDSCGCPDWTYRCGPRGLPCKGQVALALRLIVEAPAAEIEAQS